MINISQCYSTGTIKGVSKVGGLIGFCSNTTITDCYSIGNLEESPGWENAGYAREYLFRYFGGLIGTTSLGVITNCYSCGKVADVPYAGYTQYEYHGFMGPSEYGDENTVASLYFDVSKAGRTDNFAVAKSTQEMKQQNTFIGWDFIGIWRIGGGVNEGYPYLLFSYTPSEGLNVFIITDIGLKQVTEMYLITDMGLKKASQSNIIADTGLK
ncbi:MAG: hypothetical protein GX892_00285 [Thermoanaerobacteraceae bacterium]|nr:hypothetical protein [Thermoanaerobacteraceae bacterium]